MLTGSFRVIGAGVRVGEMIQQRIRSTQGGSKTKKYIFSCNITVLFHWGQALNIKTTSSCVASIKIFFMEIFLCPPCISPEL